MTGKLLRTNRYDCSLCGTPRMGTESLCFLSKSQLEVPGFKPTTTAPAPKNTKNFVKHNEQGGSVQNDDDEEQKDTDLG